MKSEKYYFEEHPFDIIEVLDSKKDPAWEYIYIKSGCDIQNVKAAK